MSSVNLCVFRAFISSSQSSSTRHLASISTITPSSITPHQAFAISSAVDPIDPVGTSHLAEDFSILDRNSLIRFSMTHLVNFTAPTDHRLIYFLKKSRIGLLRDFEPFSYSAAKSTLDVPGCRLSIITPYMYILALLSISLRLLRQLHINLLTIIFRHGC